MIKCIDEKDIALVMKQYDIKSHFKDDRSVESVDEDFLILLLIQIFLSKKLNESILFCWLRS